MHKTRRKKLPRPLFIRWEFPAVTTPDGEIRGFTVTRKSIKYIDLAMFLANNPPNKTPFKCSQVPGGYANVFTYRKDVMSWVSRRMIQSLQLHKNLDEEDQFSNIVNDLHHLSWSPGSPWHGFYLVMPNPEAIEAAKREDLWGLEGLGKKGLTYLKAKGLGMWAEPNFNSMEVWEARKTILGILRTFENMAQAALTGRKIAQLGPQQAKAFLKGATDQLARALPELEE